MKWLAALAVLAMACGAPDGDPRWKAAGATEPRTGGTFRFSSKDALSSLDPALANDDVSAWILHALVDTLVDYEVGGTALVGRLAERWDISSDGRTYRFWMREGLKYEDGSAIVAADIAYALERTRTLAGSPFGSFLHGVERVRATTDRELEIALDAPNVAFIYVLAMWFTAPLPARHVARAGDALTPLASGPYRIAERRDGERIELVPNPHYRDPARQRLGRIVMLENIARDTQFLMFQRGELEVAERMSAPDQIWLGQHPAWAPYLQRRPLPAAYGARMNTTQPPFDDRRVRQALNYALDKDVTTKLLTRTSTPSHGMMPPGTPGADDAIAPYPHDPAKARALLAEAGYPDGLALDFVTIPDEEALKIAESMQADFAEVGVAMRITTMSWSTFNSQIGQLANGLPFSFAGWQAESPDPTAYLDPLFHSRAIAAVNSSNNTFYSNPELDRLLDEARTDPDPERRAARYRRADRILHDDAPWIWNYHQMMTEVAQPYVRGYTLHPFWLRDVTTAWLDLGPDGEPVPR